MNILDFVQQAVLVVLVTAAVMMLIVGYTICHGHVGRGRKHKCPMCDQASADHKKGGYCLKCEHEMRHKYMHPDPVRPMDIGAAFLEQASQEFKPSEL